MSDEWSQRPTKRPRGGAGEEEDQKTTEAAEPEPPRPRPPQGDEEPQQRFRAPQGQYPEYPGMYPPPPGEAQPYMHPMHHFPPGAGQWPYAPHMGGYMPYPPFQPGYPPPYPPGQGMPPHYGYPEPPPHHRYSEMATAPYAEGGAGHPAAAVRGDSRASQGSVDESAEPEDYDEEDAERKMPADTSSASRARLYVKSKIPTRQEILDRRARKNAQSRSRAAKLRERVDVIASRPDSERTEEDRELLDSYQYRRQRKNDRSRERAIEKKTEIERILSKPEKKRSKIERDFLETALYAKQRKNHGDRMRRQRIKQQKMAARATGGDDSYGLASHRLTSIGYTSGMSEIPMSPLPSAHGHSSIASPSTLTSPNIMPNIAFPSPPSAGRHAGTPAPGGSQGRPSASEPQSFEPPNQQFGTGDSPATRSQLHMPQSSSDVEQRRHPDGSMTISIGRKAAPTFGGGEAAGGEESPSPGTANAGNVNLAGEDVSQLLYSIDNSDEQEQEGGNNNDEERAEGDGEN